VVAGREETGGDGKRARVCGWQGDAVGVVAGFLSWKYRLPAQAQEHPDVKCEEFPRRSALYSFGWRELVANR
jgi:hypothetical protein